MDSDPGFTHVDEQTLEPPGCRTSASDEKQYRCFAWKAAVSAGIASLRPEAVRRARARTGSRGFNLGLP